MDDPLSRLAVCGAVFALTVISGLSLARLGRPLNPAVFAIHKLSALAAVILSVVCAYYLYSPAGPVTALFIVAAAAGVLLVILLVATGGVMSFERPHGRLVVRIHQVAPLLALAASAFVFYLLFSSRA